MPIRLGLLVLAMIVALGAGPASAAEWAEGYSHGGTTRTVTGELMIRRPGVPSGHTYQLKLGMRASDGTQLFASYRSDATGTVQLNTQVVYSNGSISTVPRTTTGRQSLTYGFFAVRRSDYGGEYQYYLDGIKYNVYPGSLPSEYNQVVARSYMTYPYTGLSTTTARELIYEYIPAGSLHYWGPPSVPDHSSYRACAHFYGSAQVNFTHNQGGC